MDTKDTSTRTEALKLLETMRRVVREAPQTCVNCMHFTEQEQCGEDPLKRRPPASVIVRGCKSWTDDGSAPF